VSALTFDTLEPRLRGRLGRPYLHVAVCGSTQDLLRASGLPEGALAVAEHQTSGRGRSGRTWEDAPGSALLLSLLLKPPGQAPPLPQLSLVVALAVAECVEAATRQTTSLKWPNDVLLDGRKVAGILLEGSDEEVVCGVGINVNQTEAELPPGARLEPTSLRLATGGAHDRARILVDLLLRLERRYDAWLAAGLPVLLTELARRDALLGRAVRAGGAQGKGAGIDREGRLLVRAQDGVLMPVESGEVEVEW
jgi:BirA family biotin operon repressor/biotin-[acetyl-CoA-carboxylase] ligase